MALDVEEQITYWRDGAIDDWESATILVEKGKIRQGFFLAHLALEKALKAHVTRSTSDTPPKIHDLPRLVVLAGLEINDARSTVLKTANLFNLVGRYPDRWPALPPAERVPLLMADMGEVLSWLLQPL